MRYIIFFLVGAVAGAAPVYLLLGDGPATKAGSNRTASARTGSEVYVDNTEIDRLNKIIAELRARLAAMTKPEENPYPDDSVEKIDVLLQSAYAENNVDWLLEVIERLLMLGEKGYPALRAIIMDIAFAAKFRPSESDFRMDQLYKAGGIFTKHERKFIGFLNFLLTDTQTNSLLKQFTIPVAAFYVGAKAPGSEELQQSLMQMFMAQGGAGVPSMIPFSNMGKKINIFAMAMSGDPQMIAPLRDELKKTKDKSMQSDIIGALAYLGDPGALPLIKDRLDPNSNDDFRKEIRALARLDTDESHKAATEFVRAIPDSKRFYRHAAQYVRAGGGTAGVALIRERVQANPDDPEIGRAIGTLQRFPTKESRETLLLISTTAGDDKVAERAAKAAQEVDNRLKGIVPTTLTGRK